LINTHTNKTSLLSRVVAISDSSLVIARGVGKRTKLIANEHAPLTQYLPLRINYEGVIYRIRLQLFNIDGIITWIQDHGSRPLKDRAGI